MSFLFRPLKMGGILYSVVLVSFLFVFNAKSGTIINYPNCLIYILNGFKFELRKRIFFECYKKIFVKNA